MRRALYLGAALSAFACSFPERTFIPADEFDKMKAAGGTSGSGGSAASGGNGATGAMGGNGGITSGGTSGTAGVGGEGGVAGTTGGTAGNGGSSGGGGTGGVTTGGTGGSAGNTTGGTGGTAGGTGGTGGTGGSGTTNGLIISEYVEGSGNTKALELFNSSSSAIDIGDCTLVRHVNVTVAGATSLDNIVVATSGTMLPPGTTWTICYSQTMNNLTLATGKCKTTSSSLQHNGDDAYVLSCGGIVQDTFGEDPAQTLTGGHWGETVGVSSEDQTLRRKCSVSQGDTSLLDVFDPATEYEKFSKDDVSDLGTHCGSAN